MIPRIKLRVSDKPCARSRCNKPGIEAAGRPVLCLKHHQSYGTGRSKLEHRVKVAGEKRSFGSKWEAENGRDLRLLEGADAITGLEFQVWLHLRIKNGRCIVAHNDKHAAYYPPDVPREKGGVLVESYVADAVYFDGGKPVVTDSKAGYISGIYRRKKKWLKEGYGIVIRENHKPRRSR